MIGKLEAYGMKACPGVTRNADEAVEKYLAGNGLDQKYESYSKRI